MGTAKGRKAEVAINASTNGVNEIIAAPTDGAHIEIDHLYFVADSAVEVTLRSGSTNKTGPMSFGASGTFAFDNNSMHDQPITLLTEQAFNIFLSAGVEINGLCHYRIVGGNT